MEEDMSIVTSAELEAQPFKDRKPSGDDPVSDWLLKTYYFLTGDSGKTMRFGLIITPIALIIAFSILVSNSTPNMIAFTAMIISVVFIGISMWLLCWILDKD